MKPGVVTGDLAWALLRFAKAKGFAIPAFNCTSTSTINAVLEAGKDLNRPVMIQFSEGGSAFMAGKCLENKEKQASILGAVAGAQYTRAVAAAYGIPVLVHSDHCAKKLLPWFDGMLEFDEQYYQATGEPLFSSHMLDLSEEPHEENIGICAKYLERMAKMDLILEMEIGITGGVEDGVDNSGVAKDKLYSTPEEVWEVYQTLAPISEKFTIAAAFGNVHGVYKPGNVVLRPELLTDFQKYAGNILQRGKPLYFVFHGGSGSEKDKIAAMQGKTRRAGVANESVSPEQMANYVKPVHPKSDEAAAKILEIIKTNEKMQVLFGHLDDAALKDVINAFYSVEVAKDENVIKQGDEGDRFYIVEDGSFDIFVARKGDDGVMGPPAKVFTCGPKTAFGELALMYNAPRAATVTCAVEKATVWALDREAFQMLIMSSQEEKHKMYEGWLQDVPILKALNHYELSQLSELLTAELVEEGEEVLKQGEEGDKFYILEEGEVCAFISGEQGEKNVKTYSNPGDYLRDRAHLECAAESDNQGYKRFSDTLGFERRLRRRHWSHKGSSCKAY